MARLLRRKTEGSQLLFFTIAVAVVFGFAILCWGCTPGSEGNSSTDLGTAESIPNSADNAEPVAQNINGASNETQASPSSEELLAQHVQQIIDSMSLDQKVNQLFFITPEALTGVGTVIQSGPATHDALASHPVGGIIYFGQNLENPEQTRDMLAGIQGFSEELTGLPLFLAVDEEGGTVARVADNEAFDQPNVGDMAAIGATGDVDQAYNVAVTIGTYLKDLGFNVDFAPVADIASNPDGSMGQRSFGSDPQLVSEMVAAEVKGFLSTDVLCAAKHFPGIGGVTGDPHSTEIVSEKTIDEIRAFELLPFEAAIAAGVPFVMAGHITTPAATGNQLPATLSPQWLAQVLRDELGFQGVIITDSLSMDAVIESEASEGSRRVGVEALEAGADMLLMPQDFNECYAGVMDALASGEISEDRIDQSLMRILTTKLRDLPDQSNQ